MHLEFNLIIDSKLTSQWFRHQKLPEVPQN